MPVFSESRMLDLGTEVIAVRVGPEPNHTDFTIHETLIRKSSPFFEKSLGNKWRKAQERVVRLPTCSASAFSLYMQWLYTNRLHAIPKDASGSTSELANLVPACLLGEYLQDISFQDHVMDAIIEWKKKAKRPDCERITEIWVKIIYSQTNEISPLRLFFANLVAWHTTHEWWVKMVTVFPREFLQDVAIRFSARYKSPSAADPFRDKTSFCQYHRHGKGPCSR